MATLAGNWMSSSSPVRPALGISSAGQCRVDSSFLPPMLSFSSRSATTTTVVLGLSSTSGNRHWSSLPVQVSTTSSPGYYRRLRLLRLPRAAQEAAQAEEDTEELEEEEEEDEDAPASDSDDATPALLEEFKAAVAAKDEKRIAKLEAQLIAIQGERETLAKQVTTLLEESQAGKERLLRLNADFENFRKRSQTEKASLSSMVKGDVIESLLPMVDNFERAKSSIRIETEGEGKIDKSYQGIYKQFVEIMKGLGVVAVETVGKPFDPNLHEAIMREDSTDYEEGIVVQEFRRGFSIGSKLVRPAMVKVSAGPGPSKDGGSPEDGDGEEVSEPKGDEVVQE